MQATMSASGLLLVALAATTANQPAAMTHTAAIFDNMTFTEAAGYVQHDTA
jgi:hypothetical protein